MRIMLLIVIVRLSELTVGARKQETRGPVEEVELVITGVDVDAVLSVRMCDSMSCLLVYE